MLCEFSVVSNSLIPWTASGQTLLSLRLPWQEYRSGLPFPPPLNLPDPGFKPASPALQVDSVPRSHWGNQFLMLVRLIQIYHCLYIQSLRLVTGGLEIFLHKLYLEKSLMFRICLALLGGSGEENGYPLQYSSLEDPMDRRTWQATIRGVAELDTTERLPLPDGLDIPGGSVGKESTCSRGIDPWAGKIPWRRAWEPTPVFLPGESLWTEDPGGLQSLGLQRFERDWSDWACMHAPGGSKGKTLTKSEIWCHLIKHMNQPRPLGWSESFIIWLSRYYSNIISKCLCLSNFAFEQSFHLRGLGL